MEGTENRIWKTSRNLSETVKTQVNKYVCVCVCVCVITTPTKAELSLTDISNHFVHSLLLLIRHVDF